MKYLFCLCCYMTVSLPLLAGKLNVSQLDEPSHIDREVNKCVAIPASCYSKLRTLILEVSLKNASPSNGFYVACGNDTGNKYVEPREVDFRIGFDQGRWKLREKGMIKTYTCTNQFSQTGTKNLRMRIKVNADG